MAEPHLNFENPELLLNTFTNRLVQCRAVASAIPKQERFDEDLQNVIRKFRISSILADRYTVCIAGSQGAGKTTFLRGLYGLGQNWLEDNTGRGEKVPVLIVEDASITEPKGEIEVMTCNLNGTCQFETRPLTQEAFRLVIKGLDSEQMLPVLRVPERFFGGANLAFLLLPGYEVVGDTTVYWQELMRHSLLASAACIVVTDRTLLAESTQAEILRDMQKQYLEGTQPVIAIAKTEDVPADERQVLAKTAAKVFAVEERQMDRVVCVGTGSEDYVDSWRKLVISALGDYCKPSSVARQRRLRYLENLLSSQVPDVLGRIELELSTISEASSAAEREKNNILGDFDQSVTTIRKKYRQRLSENLEIHAQNASSMGRDRYIGEEEGLGNTLGNAWRWLGTSSGERERIHLDRINSAWKQAAGSDVNGFSSAYNDLLQNLVGSELHIFGASSEKLEDGGARLLGYGASQICNEPASNVTPEVQSCIESLFDPCRENSRQLAIPERKELRKALKLVPALALEFIRINQLVLSDSIANVSSGGVKELDLAELLRNVDASVKDLAGIHSSIIKTIAAILAVDFAADGKIDTIPALFAAIKNVVAPSAAAGAGGAAAGAGGAAAGAGGAAAGAAATAAAVVAVAFIAYSFINHIQQQDAAHRHFITVAVNSIRDQHLAKYTDLYDDLMLRIRETLEQRLMTRYRLDEEVGRRDTIVRTVAEVRALRADLLEAIRADYALG
jgi:hypothetical protein